jgi:uncharacterized protein
MRHILLALLFFCIPGWAVSITLDSVPNTRLVTGSHVSDPDRIVGAEATAEIDRLLVTLERDTGAQVAVVALDSIGQENTFDFAQALFERWGIGDRTRDNGLLMLLVKDQRTVRMHTGYGLEGALPDAICKRIQSEAMLPAFKDGRYGDGLVAGVRAVTGILTDPAQALATDTLSAAAWADKKNWWSFKFIASIFGTLAAIIAYRVKVNNGAFSTTGAGQPGTPMAMRWTAKQWWLVFAGGPTLIVLGFDQIGAGSRIIACVAALYVYFALVAGYQAWRQQRTIAGWAARDSFRQCHDLIGRRQRFWLWMALLFPIPFLFHYVFQLNRKAYYRSAPRSCPTCRAPMRRLSEGEEDAYLSKAQQVEEALHSADYDVWRCTVCEATTSTAYPGTDSTYEKCPHCKCLAYFLESNRTLLEPTDVSRGKGESIHACKFCGHRDVTAYAIAIPVASSSSSSGGSSSGGSSSGSSWGGGSSGGGGASSSW